MHVPVILFEYINRQPFLVQDHKPKNHKLLVLDLFFSHHFLMEMWSGIGPL